MERSLSCVLLLLCGLWSWVCPVPLPINKTVGNDVTLEPQYSGDPSEINWKINGNKLVDMEVRPRLNIVFYRLRDRATISDADGRLTIKNLTIGDSGLYKAEALVNNFIQEREINLIVLDGNVRPTFTSSTGPPISSVTSARKGPSFSSSHGPPETKKTKSQTEGPSSRSTTHPPRVKPTGMSESQTEGPSSRSTTHPPKIKQTGMSASTKIVITLVAVVVVMVFVGCLLWCYCCGKKRKQPSKTKDLCTDRLLTAVKSEETEAGNDVKSGVKGSSLDASGTEETEAGNDGKPEEKRSSLDAPRTEKEAGNDVKSENKRSSLDTPEPAKPGNKVQPEEKSSSLDAPGTETEVGIDVQPEEKRSSLDTPGTEETEVGDNVQPEEDEPVTVL